jgi:hypothetical protein
VELWTKKRYKELETNVKVWGIADGDCTTVQLIGTLVVNRNSEEVA